MSTKGLPPRLLYGYDPVSDTLVKIQVDSDGKVQITSTTMSAILSEIQHATYGLSALKTLIDGLGTKSDRKIQKLDCWSENSAVVTITSSSQSLNLPNVVVAGIPSGATIVRVEVLLKIALIRDSSGSDNAINNASCKVKVDADSGYGSTVTGIDIPDNSWAVDVSTSPDRGGDAIVGDNDVKTEVTQNGTYYLRLEAAQADGDNLLLLDVMVGLRVYFY